jgi:hypothetical protein
MHVCPNGVDGLRKVALSEILEILHQELIGSLTDWSVWRHHVKSVESAVQYLERNRNIGPTKALNVDFRFIPEWL